MNTNDTINRLNTIHDYQYTYVIDGVHIHPKDTIVVICNIHGQFTPTLHDHLYNKSGCPICSRERKRGDFVNRAKEKFGDRYDYSLVQYVNNHTPVTIICAHHGEFIQLPSVHLSSSHGCPKCKVQHRTSTIQQFINAATNVHGDMYNYANAVYTTCKRPIEIECKQHGIFSQTPDNHLRGSGCPRCAGDTLRGKYVASSKIAPDKHGKLYIIRMYNKHESFIKIGITSRNNVRYRYGANHAGYAVEYLKVVEMSIRKANIVEKQLLERLSTFQYRPTVKFGGYTECVDVSLDIIDSTLNELLRKEDT